MGGCSLQEPENSPGVCQQRSSAKPTWVHVSQDKGIPRATRNQHSPGDSPIRARILWRYVYVESTEQTHPSLPTLIHTPHLQLLERKRRFPEAMDLSALTLAPCTVPGIQQLLESSHYKGSAAETGRGNVVNDPRSVYRQTPINMQMWGLISSSYFPIQSQQPRR